MINQNWCALHTGKASRGARALRGYAKACCTTNWFGCILSWFDWFLKQNSILHFIGFQKEPKMFLSSIDLKQVWFFHPPRLINDVAIVIQVKIFQGVTLLLISINDSLIMKIVPCSDIPWGRLWFHIWCHLAQWPRFRIIYRFSLSFYVISCFQKSFCLLNQLQLIWKGVRNVFGHVGPKYERFTHLYWKLYKRIYWLFSRLTIVAISWQEIDIHSAYKSFFCNNE